MYTYRQIYLWLYQHIYDINAYRERERKKHMFLFFICMYIYIQLNKHMIIYIERMLYIDNHMIIIYRESSDYYIYIERESYD